LSLSYIVFFIYFLLRSINLQNRGGLTYPNYQFVSFFFKLVDIATTEILSYLAQENICKQLVTILLPHLIRNSLFICNTHKNKICKVIIELWMKPLLNNSCSQKTEVIVHFNYFWNFRVFSD
jgi:hypothetical protein